jgi:predicted RNA-binding protein associated with RNAse of E/G family
MTAGPFLLPPQRTTESPLAPAIHPPKIEFFDLRKMTNTDPKGFVREVDRYRVEPFGLYLARPVVNHPRMRYLESWLLPELNLRISDWHFHPGHERDQDFYIDIALVDEQTTCWRSVDLYLDIVLRIGRGLDVLDSDELVAAIDSGLLDRSTGQRALETAFAATNGLAKHGYRLDSWLAEREIGLTWLRH